MAPIDWKPSVGGVALHVWRSRQSLVTPIDWKRQLGCLLLEQGGRRQTLVTPIDWKLRPLGELGRPVEV